MAKICYPSDLNTKLLKMYDTGELYQCLKTGEVLDSPVSRVWKGYITKTSLPYYQKVIVPWQNQWDETSRRLKLCNIELNPSVPDVKGEKRWQYRTYTRITIHNVKGVFQYLGKEKDLDKFLSYEIVLNRTDKKFINLFYRSKKFREWMYRLSDNLSSVSLKEEEHSSAEWAGILLKGIIDFCMDVPKQEEYSRNVFLPFLHSKFLEQNIGAVREIYKTVTGEEVKNKDELAKKLNISFGDPVFHVIFNTIPLHLDTKQLNEYFENNVPDILLLSENDKPMRAYQKDFGKVLVIGGVGWAIGQLFEKCPWVKNIRKIYYWGDCDMAGYGILNMVRGYNNKVESILMDDLDKIKFTRIVKDSNSMIFPDALINLNEKEKTSCEFVKKEHIRIEQERIEPEFVKNILKKILI